MSSRRTPYAIEGAPGRGLFRLLLTFSFFLTLFVSLPTPTMAQVESGRVAFGAHYGLAKYWGSFTDDRFWMGGDLFARWNIIPYVSLVAQFGISELRYKVNDQDIQQFPDYFGPPGSTTYPGTGETVNLEELNVIRTNTYSVMATFNVIPGEVFVPYVMGGIGVMNFSPRNKNQGSELPNNLRGDVYEETQIMIPLGIGVEWYINDLIALNAKGQVHLTSTDYLDDYSNGGSNDMFATFGVGASFYVFGRLDCDDDGLTDKEEARLGTDPCSADTDKDGLGDFEEVREHGTDPLDIDTDDDGLNDFREVRETDTDPRIPDTDSDGLQDGDELARKTDPRNPDSDDDGLTDGDEVAMHKTDPLNSDTDTDGLMDGEEIKKYATNPREQDSDNDGLGDGAEVKTHGTNPANADTDADGLNDGAEVTTHKTDPKNPDTDGDKLNDGEEVNTHKTDPKNKDTDNDSLTDGEEVSVYKTNPKLADTDSDQLTDADEIRKTRTNPLNPDTDDDTVIDGLDECPLIKGDPANNGCPAPPKVGTITNFPAIYFIVDTDKFDFSRPETDENLAKLLGYVNQCDGLRVLIEGHASREGSDQRNQELSEMRSEAVKAWLIDKGVDPEVIDGTVGYGSRRNAVEEPVPGSPEAKKMDPASLEALRKQNRRIAVRVVQTCEG